MTYSTTPIDVLRDAERVFEVIKNQGIALIPGSIGYGLVASDPAALDRLFTTKRDTTGSASVTQSGFPQRTTPSIVSGRSTVCFIATS